MTRLTTNVSLSIWYNRGSKYLNRAKAQKRENAQRRGRACKNVHSLRSTATFLFIGFWRGSFKVHRFQRSGVYSCHTLTLQDSAGIPAICFGSPVRSALFCCCCCFYRCACRLRGWHQFKVGIWYEHPSVRRPETKMLDVGIPTPPTAYYHSSRLTHFGQGTDFRWLWCTLSIFVILYSQKIFYHCLLSFLVHGNIHNKSSLIGRNIHVRNSILMRAHEKKEWYMILARGVISTFTTELYLRAATR